ncbi:AraC family transcriptional regulator [Actinocorallia sp. B10E7]|uniref:helix-turn-helix transcriptional regulator n=1 Tax=Actinocorallia sp. B10E7 TaxID=3153558 RepID=UPI00325EC0EC
MTGHLASDTAEWCEDYGYGIGRPDGVRVLKYRSSGLLEFREGRQDFLNQLYWTPDGMLSTLTGMNAQFIGPKEAFWARRTADHEVSAGGGRTVYRICLRQVPPALKELSVGAVSVDAEAARLIQALATPGLDEEEALDARARIMAGLGATTREFVGHHTRGPGFALTVARALTHEPGDATRLDEWAVRLRTSVKTLQRDFDREFGMSYTQWRTRLRLQAARVLLEERRPVIQVAHRVGYASPSAFIQAFTKEYGHTPGRHVRQM